MTTVQFIEVKPFTSCCKDLEVSYHIPSSIPSSTRHYIALCEAGESSQFTWVWAGKTVPLQQEGITVKWRKGRVTFASQVLPKLSDGREYYLMYCNEDGTILGESRPFQFFTDSDEFSSIDLQSGPSDDVVMVSMHRKKAPPTASLEGSLHSNDDDTTSFEVLSEQKYTDTTEPIAGDKDPEYFSQSVTSTVIPKGDNNTSQSTASKLSLKVSDTKTDDDQLTSSYKERNYQNLPMESSTNEEVLQTVETLKGENIRLKDEVAAKDNFIEDLQAEITTLKEQALNTLSNSTVLINSPKEDEKEKRILKKRIQEETRKSARFEELLHLKETKILQMEKEIGELVTEVKKYQRVSQDYNTLQIKYKELLDQTEKYQTEKLQSNPFAAEQKNIGPTVKLANSKLPEDDIANYEIPVGGDYKTKLYLKLFKQDPFICHKCNEILPAHTQEFTRLNHIQQCQGVL